MVLKEVGDVFLVKTVASVMVRGKQNAWQRFSWLEMVVTTEHACCLSHEQESIFANTVMVPLVGPFSFWEQTKKVANTWGLIPGSRGRIVYHPNDAFG